MKATTTLLALLGAFGCLGQSYIPFPEGDATWTESHGWLNSGGGPNDSYVTCTRQIEFGTDTTITGTTYHRLYSTGYCMAQSIFPPINNWSYWEPNSLFLTFRQDIPAKQVIMYDPFVGVEQLLYDFNMGLGTYPQTMNNVGFPSTQVIRIDSVQLADGWHHVYNTDVPDLGPDSVRVIEGIGSNFGLTAAMMMPFENHERLLCFTHHDSIMWTNPTIIGDPTCSLPMAVQQQAALAGEVTIAPTAFNRSFTVSLPNGVERGSFVLYAADGSVVQRGALDRISEVNTSVHPGCYVVEVSDRSGHALARLRVMKL